MIVRRPLGSKGQIVIPKDLRDYLGLKEGSIVEFLVEDGVVVLKPASPPNEAVKTYLNVVKRKLRKRVDLKKLLDEEVMQRIDLHR